MKYYLIRNSDGDTYVSEYNNKEELLKEIETGDWGEDVRLLDSLPAYGGGDTNYWDGKMLLIKGEIVVLQKKEVVIKYDLP